MVDDGYLIGYEDTNGDFVEVGRFNNQAEDTNQPVEIVHTGSGEKVELGPGGFNANNITANSVNTESAIIGSGDTINQVEFGIESFDVPAASDNTTDTLSFSIESISFGTAFDTTPKILLQVDAASELLTPDYFSLTTSGFSIALRNYSTTSVTSKDVSWFAIA